MWTDEQRAQIGAGAAGKVVESLEWDAEGRYWVMTFTDGSETSFRFMAELVDGSITPGSMDE
jgi:YD repeat-containing protein